MIIDADAHYTPPPDIFDHPEIQQWYQTYRDKKQNSYTDIATRLQEFAALRVDFQMLNFMGISLGMNYSLPKSVGSRIMQIYNQHMHDIIQEHKCFGATMWLSLQDLPACLAELDRPQQKDFFAAFLSDTSAWGFMPEYDVLFQRLSELGMPVYLHQTEINDKIDADTSAWASELTQLQQTWPGHNFWKRTIASFIIGGVLDRWPKLKIIVAERDINWLPEFRDQMLAMGHADPMPYFQRNFWFTTEPETAEFVKIADHLGWDRLLFATDWPHDRDAGGANSLHDVATVEALPVSQEQKDRVYFKNYQTLCSQLDSTR